MSDPMLDPKNPKSPFNKWNYDSPFSITNPNSSYYDPTAAKMNVMTYVAIAAFVTMIGIFPAVGTIFLEKHPFWGISGIVGGCFGASVWYWRTPGIFWKLMSVLFMGTGLLLGVTCIYGYVTGEIDYSTEGVYPAPINYP